jgi:hypothetical protein
MATASNQGFSAVVRLIVVMAILFIVIQFFRPSLTNPPVTADLQAPAEVKQVLKTSCYNCHSNETQLPWFDRVVPAYWIAANDVKEARAQLNFSEIGNLPAAQQRGILYEAVSNIQMGVMPLPAYLRVHPHTAVTPEQLTVLKSYLNSTNPPLTVADSSAADTEYGNWVHGSITSSNVHPALNGIAFLPDYKNWRTVSSSERFDNQTIREILGNDVAVKAIAENHINPWPDGTAFAKVAWHQQVDDKGNVHTGAFLQVEFMIRDRTKYASTLGWGFARWRGTDLKPYGKDAAFATECVSCHSPLRSTNYVFTPPIGGQQ